MKPLGQDALDGGVRDHAVHGQRPPRSRSLESSARDGSLRLVDVEAVARTVAAFHAGAAVRPDLPRTVAASTVAASWAHLAAALEPHVGTSIPAELLGDVARLAKRYVEGRSALFERRRRTGAVVEGHGDLRGSDVVLLPDGPRVLERAGLDDARRTVDKIDDIAALAVDLHALGRPDLAAALMGRYREQPGDSCPDSLADHYLAHRALTRAVDAATQAGRGSGSKSADVERLARLALTSLRRATIRLVLVGGAPGAAAPTIAAGLGERSGLTVLSEQRIQQELATLAALVDTDATRQQDLASEAWTHHVHRELQRRATLLLGLGESVIIDAAFAHEWQRDGARGTARRCAADVVELVATPARTGTTPVSSEFALWPTAVALPSTESLDEAVQRAQQAIERP